jgi:MtN3 and saliva related transmembrane protein
MLHTITNSFGVIANISSNIAFIPQIIKSYRSKSIEDVSIGMFLVLFFTQICWVIYAIPIQANQLIISCVIEILLLTPIFIMWWLYSRNGSIKFDKVPIEIVSDA